MHRLAFLPSHLSSFYAFVLRAAVCGTQRVALCLSEIPRRWLMWLLLVFNVFHLAIIAANVDAGMCLVLVDDL